MPRKVQQMCMTSLQVFLFHFNLPALSSLSLSSLVSKSSQFQRPTRTETRDADKPARHLPLLWVNAGDKQPERKVLWKPWCKHHQGPFSDNAFQNWLPSLRHGRPSLWAIVMATWPLGHYSSSRASPFGEHGWPGAVRREPLTPVPASGGFLVKREQRSNGLWQGLSTFTALMNPTRSWEKNSRMGGSTSVGVYGICGGWRERSTSVSDTECFVPPLWWHLCTFATKEMNPVLLNIMWFLALALNQSLKQKPRPKCSSILRIRFSLCPISCSFFSFCH